MTDSPEIPIVMTLAGNDPTGGAGLQADIEAILSMGCHAAPVVTAVTVQDTANVLGVTSVPAEFVIEQARAVLEDMPVAAFKIGLIGSVENAEVIHSLLNDYPRIPVILDPVLASGSGTELAEDGLIEAMLELLVPIATVMTPNSLEAHRLAPGSDTLEACAMSLLDRGAEFVLVTGTHEGTPEVHNTLYGNHRRLETFTWPRLEGSFHGSGCTLASAIAASMRSK